MILNQALSLVLIVGFVIVLRDNAVMSLQLTVSEGRRQITCSRVARNKIILIYDLSDTYLLRIYPICH